MQFQDSITTPRQLILSWHSLMPSAARWYTSSRALSSGCKSKWELICIHSSNGFPVDVTSLGLVRSGITGMGGVMSKTTTSFSSVEEEISGTYTGLRTVIQLLLAAAWCQGILFIDTGRVGAGA